MEFMSQKLSQSKLAKFQLFFFTKKFEKFGVKTGVYLFTPSFCFFFTQKSFSKFGVKYWCIKKQNFWCKKIGVKKQIFWCKKIIP